MVKVLLVEDDRRVVDFVKRGLAAEGYVVDVAENGRDAMRMAEAADYALILLDRMLPDLDGLDVCQALRGRRLNAMILMLTAKDTIEDKLDGLRGGADDYLTKPFAFDELLARMAALLRRDHSEEPARLLVVGDLRLDERTKTVFRGAREVHLTAKEFALLSYLMNHGGTVVSRARLLNNVWKYGFDPGTKVVDVYIRYLRAKIDEGEQKPLIHTLRGFGYKIAE